MCDLKTIASKVIRVISVFAGTLTIGELVTIELSIHCLGKYFGMYCSTKLIEL